jgi:hypothetical protein
LTLELKVHPSFFKEFAMKTWISPYETIRELIENAFDEDATKVIVTVLSDGNVVIEDDAGMNSESVNKFLILGSPHKVNEHLSPKLKRIRTGRYGTGRLSFLTSFDNMKIKTRLDNFNKTLVINGEALENLISGRAQLQELKEPPLKRNGTEVFLNGSKISVDIIRLSKELKKLSILKYPLFELYIKYSEIFNEWDPADAQIIKSPDVQGYKIIVDVYEPNISGEIVIAKRPLGQDEKGIAIMVGNHVVVRSTFGFDNKLSRVTGYVKCDQLTSRFADKSALIENDAYFKFNQSMKDFIIERVLPSLTEYEDVLITREESKIYKEIDKVMGQAVLEMLQTSEEVEGFESIEVPSSSSSSAAEEEGCGEYDGSGGSLSLLSSSPPSPPSPPSSPLTNEMDSSSSPKNEEDKEDNSNSKDNWEENIDAGNIKNNSLKDEDGLNLAVPGRSLNLDNDDSNPIMPGGKTDTDNSGPVSGEACVNNSEPKNRLLSLDGASGPQTRHQQQNAFCGINDYGTTSQNNTQNLPPSPSPVFSQTVFDDKNDNMPNTVTPTKSGIGGDYYYLPVVDSQSAKLTFESSLIKKTIRKPVLKKTFALKKIGYKVIPYEDESDSRYSFTNENIVFVNKAHSTYKVESERGDEFLFRHITNIVAEVVVGSKYPEARDFLEIQNKLISEAIKIHDCSMLKK